MNVDLRELMRERSAIAETTVRTERVAQVRQRIALARRRRVAGVVVVVAALVATVVGSAALLPITPDSAPPPATATFDGFPEYRAGARVIGTGAGELPDSEVSVTVTPDSLDLAFAARCDPPMWIEITVEGHDLTGFSCDPDSGAVVRPQDAPIVLAGFWLVPGQPATFTATVTHGLGPGGAELPLPDSGTFALAVMQRVAFEEYPLPPRPAMLAPIGERIPPGAEFVLRSDLSDPLRPASGTIVWSASTELRILSQTPGYVHVSVRGPGSLDVDSALLVTHEEWGYAIGETSVPLPDWYEEGTIVTVTARPEHLTGAWAVYAAPTVGSETGGAVAGVGDE